MKFDDLIEEDKELIKSTMLAQSTSMVAEALQCKDVMPEEVYEREMNNAYRLIYLVNVLNDKVNYDK
ncbi:hypothetical protein [Clostridium paraputrificum]|jgi:hypothetical protein|uniref:hypothetical protein n=1 Tax=Clostridium paraputrificum TaxID=29363 RepID=UPI002066280C|nr:MAG TPA: hypothetical protein [Caudoviricetes sp.]DAE80063.1 MAG TPA: hypothetical protein [Caudoviricetes sp.]